MHEQRARRSDTAAVRLRKNLETGSADSVDAAEYIGKFLMMGGSFAFLE